MNNNSNPLSAPKSILEQKAASFMRGLSQTESDRVIVALSGGADSTALLLFMKSYAPKTEAVHVNHGLRGAESDADEAFCRRLCERLRVPLTALKVDVKGFAGVSGKSTEEAARILRYRVFSEVSGGNVLVATAHNADDNAETMLWNMIRGTGLTGLSGIPARRGNFIRPLLTVTRSEILSFLQDQKQEYVTDSSNLTDDYSRNFIRHNIMPQIEKLNPAFVKKTIETAAILRDIDGFMTEAAASSDLKTSDPILRREAIRLFFKENDIEPDYRKICLIDTQIAEKGLTKVEVGKNRYVCYDGNSLKLTEKKETPKNLSSICIKYDEDVNFGDKTIKLKRQTDKISPEKGIVNSFLTNNALDCGKIEGEIILRRKEPGDRFIKRGNNFRSKLKTLYNSMPASLRDDNIVLADRNGIIWVENFGAAAHAAATEETTDRVYVEVRHKNPIEPGVTDCQV
jgi:tRNA(Ile)-lysidine synthase